VCHFQHRHAVLLVSLQDANGPWCLFLPTQVTPHTVWLNCCCRNKTGSGSITVPCMLEPGTPTPTATYSDTYIYGNTVPQGVGMQT
jgi:hypothetical protein